MHPEPSAAVIRGLHKNYETTLAVRGIDFEARPGDIIGLVGPNGAGKTTTMRCIAGIISPTHGRIEVAGHDVIAEPVKAKSCLAYVPDDPKLFDALTVWEHLSFVGSAYRVHDWQAKAEALLTRFQLTEKRKALAGELSRGMRQKVAIVCAYLHAPKFVMLDEPLTGLDPRGIREMKDSIRELAQAGAAFLISSHLLALVEDLCTSLLIVVKGKQLFFGPMSQAREAFGTEGTGASLEEVFFRATEGAEIAPAGAPQGAPGPGAGA